MAKTAMPEPTLIASIDFGTYASGVSWHLNPEGPLASKAGSHQAVRIMGDWPGERFPYTKTATAILYKDGQPAAWGWEAVEMYAQMPTEQLAPRGPYTYASHFKLCLEPASEGARRHPLPAGLRVVTVVADYLKCLRRHAMARIRAQLDEEVDPAAIRWCVTVPALWSDTAKDLMRSAATRAGLADTREALLMTYEPEAAALAAAYKPDTPWMRCKEVACNDITTAKSKAKMFFTRGPAAAQDLDLKDGDVVLVVDVGGGTSDLTLHRVVSGAGVGMALRLEEAAVGSGAFHAGASVDAAFDGFCSMVSANWEDFRTRDPASHQYLQQQWQDVKRDFNGSNSLMLHVPEGLRLRAEGGCTAVAATGLELSPARVAALYDPTIDAIIAQARAILSSTGGSASNTASNSISCDKVLLVGGFCASRYVQARLRRALGSGATRVVVPAAPEAAVVLGAVLYGMQPGAIAARYMRASYGYCTTRKLTPALKTKLGRDWQQATFQHRQSRLQYVDDVYSRFVKRGEKVYAEQVVECICHPLYSNQSAINVTLYKTPHNDAVRVVESGMVKVASLVLPLPPGWNANSSWKDNTAYRLKAALHFGGTELRVRATDMQTGETVEVVVTYDHQ